MTTKSTPKTLLFTGGGGAGTEALNRLLGSKYRVHFADADPCARPDSVSDVKWHQIPFASAPQFTSELRGLCERLSVDALIPGVDEELLLAAHLRGSMQCEVLLPPAHFIETHLDKLASSASLKAAGLPVPLTELAAERRMMTFPCVAKPRSGRGSRGVAVVRSAAELDAHLMLSRRPASDFIVQEQLEGQEFTVMMAADRHGKLRAVVPVKVEIKRGITLRAQTEYDETVIRACTAIHEVDPAPGCYNIQLVKSASGSVKPFEINPRISTTACLGVAAGVDFIDLYFGQDSKSSESVLVAFRNGLKLRRSWLNEFSE